MKNLVFLSLMAASTAAFAEQELLLPTINAQEISAAVEAKINDQVNNAVSDMVADVNESSAAESEKTDIELSVANRL